MQVEDFDFELPADLIAHFPASQRTDSRLLVIDPKTARLQHRIFHQLPDLLRPNDLLVFNDTRVIPARLYGQKESGGKIEVLIERPLDQQRALAQIRASKAPKAGSRLWLADRQIAVEVLGRHGDFFELAFDGQRPLLDWLDAFGQMPLPPYIERQEQPADRSRYQTVYGKNPGAIAAPTAGLHFSPELLTTLAERGIESTFVTLHVGAGTYQPVRVSQVEQHQMHSEYLQVGEDCCRKIAETRKRGGRVIAVGTTSVRSLETAAQSGCLHPFAGDTRIFIYPGYRFQVVDALITNFHLPKSTLMMLVSALAGRELIQQAYQAAIHESYRFFSYGDAMFIESRHEI